MNEVNSERIAQAVAVLRGGGLVALPTETVYGLAADAENELAVRRIFAVKGRPESHPLIVHLPSLDVARDGWIARASADAERLAAAFWPGPLTLVFPRGPRALDVVTGGQDTVAIRVPAHPLARGVLQALSGGVAAPSANRFGRTSPTTADHVREDLGGEVDLIVDGGACAVGVESTIVDLTGPAPALLRPGGVGREALEEVLGAPLLVRTAGGPVRAPGMLASHYAPRAGVVLASEADLPQTVASLIAQGRRVGVISPSRALPEGAETIVVPPDADGLARLLYASLREADARALEVVVVQLPPEGGLGLAVRDRLHRAAAPRT